jgi:hypothetical protein
MEKLTLDKSVGDRGIRDFLKLASLYSAARRSCPSTRSSWDGDGRTLAMALSRKETYSFALTDHVLV